MSSSSSSIPLVWFITGCSSGFGASLAALVLESGHKVIATSRNPSRTPELVKQIESHGGTWLRLDVNSPDSGKVIQDAIKVYGRIDVLVNNAGYGILGALEDMNDEEAEQQFQTNFFGPYRLIRAILPHMRERRSGTIVNISSAAAIVARPSMGLYGASKAALEGLSQTLSQELQPFNIRVLIVQPGGFRTNMPNATSFPAKGISAPYKDTPTGQIAAFFDPKQEGGVQYKAPNDVQKGCQAIFEVVTGTGRGKGKEKYVKVPLSEDCAMRALEVAEGVKEGVEAFRKIWENTGVDE